MTYRKWNFLALAIFALFYWAYFQYVASDLPESLSLDPLIFNGVIVPAVFGVTLYLNS